MMKATVWLAVVALVLVGGVRADDAVDDPDVVVLSDDNFSDFINDNELTLVEFYAPWCGHCKRLAPEYAKAATELLKLDPPVKLGKVDATEHGELAGRFDVRGYPTLKVFREGSASEYNGPRDADGIVEYMKKQVGPAAKAVASAEELKSKYLENEEADDYHVVGFFSDTKSRLHSSFLVVAEKMRDSFTFLKVTEPSLIAEWGVDKEEDSEAIYVVRRADDARVKYEGNTQTKNVQKFVESNRIASLGEYTKSTAKHYRAHPLPVAKLYTKVDWKGGNKKHTKYYWNRLKKLSEEFDGQLVFAIANRADHEDELSELNVDGEDAVYLIEDKDERYLFEDKFGLKQLRAFTQKFVDGEAERWMKSEKVPEKNDGPVTVAVGRNFDEVVMDETKDVMIEFYAPWCGHCKALAPKYEKLGKKFRKNDNIVIAKIDATANDFPRDKFAVSGYPTIYFKPAGKNAKIVKYEGAREVDSMKNWIKRRAKSAKKGGKKNKKKKKSKKSKK